MRRTTNQPGGPTSRVLLSTLVLISFLGTATAQATKHPFLWRIESKDGHDLPVTCWLYGTMHMGDKRLVTLPAAVDAARESVDALYCELAIDKMPAMEAKMKRRLMLPAGEKLSDHLPVKLYQRLDRALAKRGASAKAFSALRVWGVSLVLVQLDAARLGMKESLDKMLYADAKKAKKEVGGLETVEEQLDAFTNGAVKDHVAMLRESLDYLDKLEAKGQHPLRRLLDAYLSGDPARLEEIIDESSGDKELLERMMKPLLADRNVRMADRMMKMMQKHPKKSYFFAVGSGHYLGDKGILALLKQKGYQIVRIAPPPKKTNEKKAKVRKLEKVK